MQELAIVALWLLGCWASIDSFRDRLDGGGWQGAFISYGACALWPFFTVVDVFMTAYDAIEERMK